ncbi:MAG: transposase [Bdellovibrionales bacterium]|nr:transposase [Bdellovibrionales bacterium]
MVMQDPRRGFEVRSVRYEECTKDLSSHSGLQAILRIFDSTDLGKELAACLPEEGSNRAYGSYQLGLLLIASLLSGHDSIDDIEEFEDDDLIETLFGGSLPTAKTIGNFLRRFTPENIRRLKLFLTKMGYTLRAHIKGIHSHKGEAIPHFKIDTTTHEQHGRQMEGCGWIKTSDDKSVYGYASQTVFDEVGFCYAGELLEAAHPKGDTPGMLDQVLSPLRGKKIENPFERVADVSGDSAYLNEDVIRTVQAHHSTFTIAAPKTIQWHNQVENAEWQSWIYSEDQIKKLKKKKKSPPECYLTRWHWAPGFAEGKLMFPVIIKKEWREDEVMGEACGSFHYHAVATNRDLSNKSYQSIIEAYRPRAEVENQIKEFKINFDAKHLPCLKMSANETYFLFVLIAQNLTRWVALLENPDKPHYAKKIRRKLIHAPATILTGSRQIVLRVKNKFHNVS